VGVGRGCVVIVLGGSSIWEWCAFGEEYVVLSFVVGVGWCWWGYYYL